MKLVRLYHAMHNMYSPVYQRTQNVIQQTAATTAGLNRKSNRNQRELSRLLQLHLVCNGVKRIRITVPCRKIIAGKYIVSDIHSLNK